MVNVEFRYKAFDKSGNDIAGVIAAGDKKHAFEMLNARGLSPYDVALSEKPFAALLRERQTITKKHLTRYIRQLATLLMANVSVLDALTTLGLSGAHEALAQQTQKMKRDLRAGQEFSAALERHLPEFPVYVFRLAELGEATGAMAKALNDAADRMEYEMTVSAEIRSALTYPAFLAGVGSVIVIAMFIFVVPRFADLLGDNITEAPWISQRVIGLGIWLQANWWLAIAIMGIAIIGFAAANKNAKFRRAAHTYILRVPVIGGFLRQAEIGAWARTVSVALNNKAQLVDALRLGEGGAQSVGFRRNLETVRRGVRAGQPLEEVLAEVQRDIDPMIIDLIRTGRSSGTLGEMLAFAAEQLEKESREYSKRLTALTEPIAILTIATIVGVIVVSIVLAMTSLYQFEI